MDETGDHLHEAKCARLRKINTADFFFSYVVPRVKCACAYVRMRAHACGSTGKSTRHIDRT